VRSAVLDVHRIAKRYGDVVACQDVTFAVHPGDVFGLVGAGSTTLLRIVLGVLAPDSGAVRLGGEPITLAVRRRVGYLPAERGLYPRMRVHDQLVYLAELHGHTTNDAHRATDFWLARFGLRARSADRVRQLSAADRQRLHLAAALVHGPDLLVLDEPFTGLEPDTAETLADVLAERAGAGVPVLLAAASLDVVERVCDRVGVLHNGRMAAVGALGEFRAHALARIVVDAPAAKDGWADALPGVTVLTVHNGLTTLTLGDGPADADDQAVLAAALATGPVRGFTRREPSLADLFPWVVE
jgi:ABC-2 type transport system ATP-binding protein